MATFSSPHAIVAGMKNCSTTWFTSLKMPSGFLLKKVPAPDTEDEKVTADGNGLEDSGEGGKQLKDSDQIFFPKLFIEGLETS